MSNYEEKKLRKELIAVLYRSKEEVIQLRRTIDHLAPKAEAYDNLKALIRFLPGTGGGSASEDWAWRIQQRIVELEAEEKKDAGE